MSWDASAQLFKLTKDNLKGFCTDHESRLWNFTTNNIISSIKKTHKSKANKQQSFVILQWMMGSKTWPSGA